MSIIILKETLNYLRISCIWPSKGEELNPDQWFYLKFFLMMVSSSVILLGSTGHLIVSIQYGSNNITDDMVLIIAEIGVFYFITIFVVYQKKIAEIYVKLSDFNKFGKPHNFDDHNKKLLFLSRVYKNFLHIIFSSICVFSYFNNKICKKQNETRDFKEVCGLFMTTWMPFNINFFPMKQIMYLWQCYSFFLNMKGAALISYAIMEPMEHLATRIQYLKVMVTEAVSTEDVVVRNQRFSFCVEYHIDIFDLGKKIDRSYTACLFLHVLLSGALFGCIGYRFMESFSINSLTIFLGWVNSLIIVCMSGQRLMDEAVSVADAAYNSKWYNTDADFQKKIAFMIARSQWPIVVHAGPLSYLSHLIILTIFQTAYSYLTLLKAASM